MPSSLKHLLTVTHQCDTTLGWTDCVGFVDVLCAILTTKNRTAQNILQACQHVWFLQPSKWLLACSSHLKHWTGVCFTKLSVACNKAWGQTVHSLNPPTPFRGLPLPAKMDYLLAGYFYFLYICINHWIFVTNILEVHSSLLYFFDNCHLIS